MTGMKLREPAANLWKKHHEAVRRISNAPGGESRLLIGGGSVLAAEWGHRKSMDIDVLLPEREGMQDAGQGGPVDLAAATGGETGASAMRPGEGSNEREAATETRTPGGVPSLPAGGAPAEGRAESPAGTADSTVQRVGGPKIQNAIGGGTDIPMPDEAPSRAGRSAKSAADKTQDKGKVQERD